MKYFKLTADCFLVRGKTDGAIYDVHGRTVFLLDERACKILCKCEANQPLGKWLGESGIRFLETLRDKDLGYFCSAPAYVDKMLIRSPVEWKGFCMQPPVYYRVDWGITNQCDLSCNFCANKEKTLSWQSCQTCLRRNKNAEVHPAHYTPEELVDQIAGLGVRILHIRGGNPLLKWDYLLRITKAIRSYPGLSLVISTHAINRTVGDLLKLCAGDQVRLNIVMFGISDKITEAICGRANVWNKQLAIIDALVAAETPPFLTFLLSHATKNKRREFQEFIEFRWNGRPSFAEVHLRQAVRKGFRLSHIDEYAKPLSPWRSVHEFFFRLRFNTCTYGNFEISSDGKIRSCSGLDHVCGDISINSLQEVLAGPELYNTWELGKKNIRPCSYCVLRYACTDCTALEIDGAKNPIIKQAYCPYEPGNKKMKASGYNWSPLDLIHLSL